MLWVTWALLMCLQWRLLVDRMSGKPPRQSNQSFVASNGNQQSPGRTCSHVKDVCRIHGGGARLCWKPAGRITNGEGKTVTKRKYFYVCDIGPNVVFHAKTTGRQPKKSGRHQPRGFGLLGMILKTEPLMKPWLELLLLDRGLVFVCEGSPTWLEIIKGRFSCYL